MAQTLVFTTSLRNPWVDGDHLVSSQNQYGVELLGPVVQPGNWQAKEVKGFDLSQFVIDWQRQTVTCPEGKVNRKWVVRQDADAPHVPYVISAQFRRQDCLACPSRPLCTRSQKNPRQVTLRPQAHHEATQAARKQQTTQEFKERYAKRSGIEGTISQGVRAFDLRVCRYLGMEKTHVQHLLTAFAMNVVRLFQWQMGDTPSQPRISRFAALAL